MKRSKSRLPFADDADNVELVERFEKLAELFGLTQREVAEELGITSGQLSRIRKGERHAARKHVRALCDLEVRLKKERGIPPKRETASVFSIDHSVLSRLSATGAVEAFRNLLWARAAERAVPTTLVSISSDVFTADGGVDASILEHKGPQIPEDELLTAGTRYQIKTGKYEPWKPSVIKTELFGKGKKDETFGNLGSAIQETLREGKRYVLVCFGVDPVDTQLRKARKNLKTAFGKCGYPDAEVEVWGQTPLIGLFDHYPSLCLRLMGYDQAGFRAFESWASQEDMQPAVHYSAEQQGFINDCRDQLRSGEIRHLRLIGEPGVGKTRLSLEITRAPEMAAATLYVGDGRTFLKNSFINELVQADDHRFVVLVIDECPRNDRAAIWNVVKSKSDRIRLITIDHGPDDETDELMRLQKVEPVGPEQIVSILKDHGIGEFDAKRWAEFCEGCPRVAHVVGENLRQAETDLLRSPATVNVWDRFIVGRDDSASSEVELRKRVLRYISLFEKFGFEHPVDEEAKYIAQLAEVSWPEFQGVVAFLRQRRVLQGATTLYLTPQLLQLHLYSEFWDVHGASFDVNEALKNMPGALQTWFIRMLRFAHDSRSAESAVERLLGYGGLFPDDYFPNNQRSGTLIQSLAEACPQSTLHCLRRTIGEMDVEALRRLDESRQQVVWALERLAVWKDCFHDSATLLLDLAEAENAEYSNNSTGTFCQLFSLIPGMAGTEASFSDRRRVLEQTLNDASQERRMIGLKACKMALETSGGFRMVGPEHQGLRRTVEFWMPKTYGEHWDAYRAVWGLLTEKLDFWEGEDRLSLISTLISAGWSLMYNELLRPMVIDTLKAIARDPDTDVTALITLIQRRLRHAPEKLSDDERNELQAIIDDLDGHDFHSSLVRFIRHMTWEDSYDEDVNGPGRSEQKLDELADEAMGDIEMLTDELPWLVCEESSPAYSFGVRLGRRDPEQALLDNVLELQFGKGDGGATQFLSGYLATIFDKATSKWESIMMQLADNPATAARFSDFVIATGISDVVVRRVIEQCRMGKQKKERLQRWWFASQIRTLSSEVFQELVVMQLEECTGQMWSNAIQMCHTYYLEKDHERVLPEELMFTVLTHPAMGEDRAIQSAGYYWSRLSGRFLEQHKERKWDFFRAVLTRASQVWSILLDMSTQEEQVLTTILQESPETAFDCITDVYRDGGDQLRRAMQRWLCDGGHRGFSDDSPGPIQYIRAQSIFDWVDSDVDDHGYWIARALPKTLDDSPGGRLTRNFIARYGRNRSISGTVNAHFYPRRFCGNASDYYRKLREDAREWLVDESDPTVVRWIEDYIHGLGHDIDRSELDEERRG